MFCTYQLGKHLFVYSCVCVCVSLLAGVLSSKYLAMVMLLKDIDKLFDSFNSVKHAAPASLLNDNSRSLDKASTGMRSWIFLKGG